MVRSNQFNNTLSIHVFICLIAFLVFGNIASAQINCPPNLPLTLNGNTEYCVGSSGSQLSVAQSYDQYEWLPTTETSQSVLLTAGNYQLVVTHYTGCTDTLEIEVQQVPNPPQPTVTANGSTEICAGESVVLSGPAGYPYYEWNSGSISESITVYESGTYVLSIEDWIGCTSSSNAIQVIVNPQPFAAFSPDLEMFDVSFNNLSTDATNYLWNFGDGSTSTDFEPTHSFTTEGALDMYLVAENGCGSDTAFLLLGSVGIEQKDLSELRAYPNPVADNLNIEFYAERALDLNIQLVDLAGRVVFAEFETAIAGNNRIALNPLDLNSGIYLLEIHSQASTFSFRILVL